MNAKADTPAPVTPRTARDRLFDEVDRRFGRNVARFVDARLDAIAGLEKSSTSFEREAAAPAATEALRAALDPLMDFIGRLDQVADGNLPLIQVTRMMWLDVVRPMLNDARAALASPEPTPDSGLDVERLAAPLHDWLLVYNKDRQPYPGQCTGTHMIGMGDCQFAARAIRARLSSADPSESSA